MTLMLLVRGPHPPTEPRMKRDPPEVLEGPLEGPFSSWVLLPELQRWGWGRESGFSYLCPGRMGSPVSSGPPFRGGLGESKDAQFIWGFLLGLPVWLLRLAACPAPSQVLPELLQLLLQPSHPLPSPSLPLSLPSYFPPGFCMY